MATTQPTPPGQLSGNVLFYSKPEPLAKELHSKLGVKRMDGPFGFAKAGHAIPLTVGEFPRPWSPARSSSLATRSCRSP